MSLKYFEEYTEELTAREKILYPIIKESLMRLTKEKPMTGAEMCAKFNLWISEKNNIIRTHGRVVRKNGDDFTKTFIKMNNSRLGKFIQKMRIDGIPIISVDGKGRGYYHSNNREDIVKQIESLQQRSRGVLRGAIGLEDMLKTKIDFGKPTSTSSSTNMTVTTVGFDSF